MESKILEYLNTKLHPELEKLQTQKVYLESKIRSYYELYLFFVHQRASQNTNLKGLVKVACEFYMEAEGNCEKVAVETGVPGLYIELTPDEGSEYIKQRQALLEAALDRCRRHIEDLESQISLIARSMSQEVDIKEPYNN